VINKHDQKILQIDLEIKNRNYGIDLLRIITMFMIVNLHILYHGGILSSEKLYFGSCLVISSDSYNPKDNLLPL